MEILNTQTVCLAFEEVDPNMLKAIAVAKTHEGYGDFYNINMFLLKDFLQMDAQVDIEVMFFINEENSQLFFTFVIGSGEINKDSLRKIVRMIKMKFPSATVSAGYEISHTKPHRFSIGYFRTMDTDDVLEYELLLSDYEHSDAALFFCIENFSDNHNVLKVFIEHYEDFFSKRVW